jgi:hypothetical protein
LPLTLRRREGRFRTASHDRRRRPNPAAPDPNDHVARLQAEIDAARARRAGYRAKAAETVARGRHTRATDEELGIIKTDDTVGKIAGDASQQVGSALRRAMSRLRRSRKR